jgi:hypothetical protein
MHSYGQRKLNQRATQKMGLGENIHAGFCKKPTERIPDSSPIERQKFPSLGKEDRSDTNGSYDVEIPWVGFDQTKSRTKCEWDQKNAWRRVIFQGCREADKKCVIQETIFISSDAPSQVG